MTIRELQQCLTADIFCNEENIDIDVCSACGSDLMSDVLAYSAEKMVLMTGLINPHVIRTAEMLDACAVVFVRGKIPPPDLIEAARAQHVVLLSTNYTLFDACGILYAHGLRGKSCHE